MWYRKLYICGSECSWSSWKPLQDQPRQREREMKKRRLWHISKRPRADLEKGLDKDLFWAGSNIFSSSSCQPTRPWVCTNTREEPNWAGVAVGGINAGHYCQHRVNFHQKSTRVSPFLKVLSFSDYTQFQQHDLKNLHPSSGLWNCRLQKCWRKFK